MFLAPNNHVPVKNTRTCGNRNKMWCSIARCLNNGTFVHPQAYQTLQAANDATTAQRAANETEHSGVKGQRDELLIKLKVHQEASASFQAVRDDLGAKLQAQKNSHVELEKAHALLLREMQGYSRKEDALESENTVGLAFREYLVGQGSGALWGIFEQVWGAE